MKPFHFHLIYLSIIAVLGFQNWQQKRDLDSFANSLVTCDDMLKANNQIIKIIARERFRDVSMQVKAYANAYNLLYWDKVKTVDEIAKTQLDLLKSNDSTHTNPLKLTFFRDSIISFRDKLLELIEDKRDLKSFEKDLSTTKLIQNKEFWKDNDKQLSSTLLQNSIELDKLHFWDYVFSKVGGYSTHWEKFKVAIAPQKEVLIEGETFSAQLYLAEYFNTMNSNVEFFVNNKPILVKNGDAFLNLPNQTIGTKNLKLEARIKNILTGQVEMSVHQFEYEVLPKCSRDCR